MVHKHTLIHTHTYTRTHSHTHIHTHTLTHTHTHTYTIRRTVFVVPAVITMAVAVCTYHFSDDTPLGQLDELSPPRTTLCANLPAFPRTLKPEAAP